MFVFSFPLLEQNWDAAYNGLKNLKEIVDQKGLTSAAAQLESRTWLMHWSLFVCFNHESGKSMLLDIFLTDARYLHTIQVFIIGKSACKHVCVYVRL